MKFLDPLYSYATAEDTNFRFRPYIDHSEYDPKDAKLGQIDTHSGSRDLLLNFGTPYISLESVKLEVSSSAYGLTASRTKQEYGQELSYRRVSARCAAVDISLDSDSILSSG